jgi:hypothetical protein
MSVRRYGGAKDEGGVYGRRIFFEETQETWRDILGEGLDELGCGHG